MSKSRKTRTRRHRRANAMKLRSGGGVRKHARTSGRTGMIRAKRLHQGSVRA